MLKESLARPSRVRLCFRALLLVWVLAVLTMRLWAQDLDDADNDDDDSGGSFASLTLRYDQRGKLDASYIWYGEVQNWAVIEARLEQALHCPTGSLVNPPPNPTLPKYLASRPANEQARYREYAERVRKNTLSGECPAGMTRAGLLLSTDIPLQALTAELKSAGVTKLSISVTYPKSKYSEQTPGIKYPWESESSGTLRQAAHDFYAHANYLVDTSAPALSQIHLTFGLRDRDAVRAAILPVVFLISPILICLWMSRAALRDAKADSTAAWFSYFRVLTWCGNCLVLIWMMGQTVRQGLEVVASYYTAAHTAGAVALEVGILLLPPWLAFFLCIVFSYPVYRQVRGEAWTRREFFLNQFLGIASQFLPLAFLFAAMGMISVNGQAAAALFAGIYVSYIVCKWLHAKYAGLHIEPLATGELRDKVFEIAKKAAVEVRGVFVVPAGKSQMANAFASRSHLVMFTDYLLSRFNKREVSAIAAHEVAHIQKKHSAWKTGAFILLIFSSHILYGVLNSFVEFLRHAQQARQAEQGANAAAGLASLIHFGDRVLAFPELILILFTLALFLYHLHSQYLEYVADAGSVQFTGDPEAMITSLLKLSRLNLTPVQWDRATGSLLTHPSTLKRVQRIARVGQVPPERLQQLLVESANPQAQSETNEAWEAGVQFDVARPRDPVVTLQRVGREITMKKWALRFIVIAPSAAIAWTVAHYHLQHKNVIFAIAGALCIGLYITLGEWQAMWFRKGLKRRFIARLESEDIDASMAQIVCLSPHPAPRVYPLGYFWDQGCLLLCKDRLCFVGDQIRFALKPEQIVSVRLGPGAPDWIGEPRTYLEWRVDSATPVQIWNLRPQDPSTALGSKRQCIELPKAIERWRTQTAEYPEVPHQLRELPPPRVGEVTSQRLKAVITFGRFLKVASFSLILAVVVWAVFDLPSLWFVCLLELVATVYSFSPFWFYKETAEGQFATSPVKGLQVREDLQSGD